jgi:hypothetical protein
MKNPELVWTSPNWNRHVEEFGNNFFYAIEAVACDIIGVNQYQAEEKLLTPETEKPEFSNYNNENKQVHQLFEFIISLGEFQAYAFLAAYQKYKKYKHLKLNPFVINGAIS